MPLTPEERKLITHEGFETKVQQLAAAMPLAQAYELVESEVESITGLRVYSSLNAYKISRLRLRENARRGRSIEDKKHFP